MLAKSVTFVGSRYSFWLKYFSDVFFQWVDTSRMVFKSWEERKENIFSKIYKFEKLCRNLGRNVLSCLNTCLNNLLLQFVYYYICILPSCWVS